MPILETQDLTYVYGAGTPFEKTAVDHISLQIEEGELVGLIGHTGSGKSTFVQQLNGLLKPTSGKVLLKGKDIWAEPKKIRAIRFQVGMVDIARIADRVLVIDDGKVAMFEKTDRVFAQSARLSQMGLRVPQITKIMTMLREKGYPVSSGVLTVEQGVQEILRILGREEESRGQ